MATSHCMQCNKEIIYKQWVQTGKFCSNKCQMDHRHETITVPRVEAGLVNTRSTLLSYLIRKYGRFCWSCKQTEWMGVPIPLELNHIDGDASNNFPENIECICPNCHALTPTYKGRNKGNGRKSRGLI